jgi:tRNA 2-thiocytidine biosynthesis protein TtcA
MGARNGLSISGGSLFWLRGPGRIPYGLAMPSIEERLARRVRRTSLNYGLLEPDDQVMVAVSGGKDSYTMLHMLHRIGRKLPFSVRFVAVHLDQQQPDYDGAPLIDHLEASGFEYEILSEDTYSLVLEHTVEGKAYCSVCSRLRRGILYTAAERLGCNKIALGHHRDDALETFMMNMFFSGKLQAMPARYQTNDKRFDVIRPLIECAEADIAEFATQASFPILPCNLCGSQPGGTQRDAMKRMLSDLEGSNPNVRAIMLNAIRNVRPTHLLDQDLIAAWSARPPEVRPDPEPKKTQEHAHAQPVVSRLRVVS